jgi:hypothetical protein
MIMDKARAVTSSRSAARSVALVMTALSSALGAGAILIDMAHPFCCKYRAEKFIVKGFDEN